jgi:hypothetical protein
MIQIEEEAWVQICQARFRTAAKPALMSGPKTRSTANEISQASRDHKQHIETKRERLVVANIAEDIQRYTRQ